MNRGVIVWVFVFFCSSCIIKKVDKTRVSALPKTAKELITKANLKNKMPEWMALKGSVNLILEDNKEVSLGIMIKIRKDSVIWGSVSAPFGIELFRTMLTKDSLYYINRTNKTFFIKHISHFDEFFNYGLTFSNLQEIISGNIRIKNQQYKLQEGFSLLSEQTAYFINPTTFRIKSMKQIGEQFFLEVNYSYSAQLKEGDLPNEVRITSNFKEKTNIKLAYTNIVLNEKQKLPFKIHRSYVEKK